jgi:hypothetical protein
MIAFYYENKMKCINTVMENTQLLALNIVIRPKMHVCIGVGRGADIIAL